MVNTITSTELAQFLSGMACLRSSAAKLDVVQPRRQYLRGRTSTASRNMERVESMVCGAPNLSNIGWFAVSCSTHCRSICPLEIGVRPRGQSMHHGNTGQATTHVD